MSKYRNYKNPVTTTENIKELQEILVQTCIDYIKRNNLTDIGEAQFKVDGIQEGVEFGEWTPGMDSHICVMGLQDGERRIIGEYC